MANDIPYQLAAMNMLSAASAAVSGGYAVVSGFDYSEDHLAIAQPVISVAALGDYSQGFNSDTGSFACVLAEPVDSSLTNAENVKAVAYNTYNLIKAFHVLAKNTAVEGYLIEARAKATSADIYLSGPSYHFTNTNIRYSTFTIEWGLSES
jgi:hypothetical protein